MSETPTETILGARTLALRYMQKGIWPYIHGAPGVGKSDIFGQIAEDEKIGFVDLRLGTKLPEDLSGIPVPDLEKMMAVWLKAEFWPDEKRDGKRGIILFDEMSDAPRALQSAAYQVILDGCIGRHHLPKSWWRAAAGNRREDRAAAQTISTALANRFAHIHVEPDVDSWVPWADKHGIDPRIIGFLRFRREYIHKIGDGLAFPSPRTWARASLVADEPDNNFRLRLIRGIVGEAAAAEFNNFLETLHLPSLEDILAKPKTCQIPEEPSAKYALVSMLARAATRDNFKGIIEYCKRPEFGADFETCMVLDASRRDEAITEVAAFRDWALRNKDIHL